MRGKLWQCFYYAEKVKNKMRGNEKKKKKNSTVLLKSMFSKTFKAW